MAISASTITASQTLEEFRLEYNKLQADVSTLKDSPTFASSISFEGATDDDYETTITAVDPTADRAVSLQNKGGTLALIGTDTLDTVQLNGTDSSSTNAGDNLVLDGTDSSSTNATDALLYEDATADHLLNQVPFEEYFLLETSFHGSDGTHAKHFLLEETSGDQFEVEFATSDSIMGAPINPPAAGGPQFIAPTSDGTENQVLATDGSGNLSFVNQSVGLGVASGDVNNRVMTMSGSSSAVGEGNLLFDGSTLTVTGNITVPNDGDIGSVGATDAIQISSGGIVTFKDDLLIKDGGTIGVASSTSAITIASSGIVTFVDDILIKDGGTIGSASDTDAMAISSGGVVSFSATTEASATGTAAVTLAGGIGVAKDMWIGDDIVMDSDAAVIKFGDDQEIELTHVHNTGLSITSTAAAPLVRRGEDVFIVLDGTNSSAANAGDNVIMDRSAAGTDVGDDILGEDEVFLHSGMQRNVINIVGSDGKVLNSVAGFAPGAI